MKFTFTLDAIMAQLKAVGIDEIPEATKKALAQVEKTIDSQVEAKAMAEEEDALKSSIAKAVRDLLSKTNYELKGTITVRMSEDGLVVEFPKSKISGGSKGSGKANGGFGGSERVKVKGPFKDTQTGQVYGSWPKVVRALYPEHNHEGRCTRECGYFKYVDDGQKHGLKASGRVVKVS